MARVPYRGPDDLPEASRDLVVSKLQPGKTINVYRAVANNPPLLEGLRAYFESLWAETGLSDRQRELVVLAVARERSSTYEWHQHVNVARSVGLSDDEIRAIGSGDLDAFDEDEAALVRYAGATAAGEVDDALHDAVAAVHDDATIVGVAALAAGYAGLALLVDALGVDSEEAFVGWDPS